MYSNLSAAILYYYCVKNNIYIPIIIPFLIGFRGFILLQPDDSTFKKISFLQKQPYIDIEYYSSIIISVIMLLYLYFNDESYQNYISVIFFSIIVLYLLLLLINFINLYY